MLRSTGIIVAAGNSTRMGGDIPKQFINIAGKPMLYWSLKAFETSECDGIIIVTGEDSIDYVDSMIVRRYGIGKVRKIVAGGKQRYDSVYAGLSACEADDDRIVLIHDAARPLVRPGLINALTAEALVYGAAAAAAAVVDTVRTVQDGNFTGETLDRKRLRAMQTPQAFRYGLIKPAYDAFMNAGLSDEEKLWITDDVMILELMAGAGAHLIEPDFCNIKVTNPEDATIAETFLKK